MPLAATAADVAAPASSRSRCEVKEFGAGIVHRRSRSDTTAPYSANWNSTARSGRRDRDPRRSSPTPPATSTRPRSSSSPSTRPDRASRSPIPAPSSPARSGSPRARAAAPRASSFGVSPAGAGTWTEIASDTSAPFAAAIDTSDPGRRPLRPARGRLRRARQRLRRPSRPGERPLRQHGPEPGLVRRPPTASVSTSANQIVLTGSEPVTAPGALLDGVAAPAPSVSGNDAHVRDRLARRRPPRPLRRARGRQRQPHALPRRDHDREHPAGRPPPVEKRRPRPRRRPSWRPGRLATVQMPASRVAGHPPDPKDFLVLHVDPIRPRPGSRRGSLPAADVEVTARWALAGTNVHDFDDALEVLLEPAAAGTGDRPSRHRTAPPGGRSASVNGTTLPVGRARRLLPRLGRRARAHAPPHLLRLLRRRPAADPAERRRRRRRRGRADPALDPRHRRRAASSARSSCSSTASRTPRSVRPSSRSSWVRSPPGDTRVFTLPPVRRRGQRQRALARRCGQSPRSSGSMPTPPRQGSRPPASLSARSRGRSIATVAPGTVVGPTKLLVAAVGSSIDVVAAAGSPQTKFVFRDRQRQGGQGQGRQADVDPGPGLVSTRPASGSAMLATGTGRRLYTWRFQVKAGATIAKLRLPSQVRRPGYYRLIWSAHSGSASARKAVRIRFVGPALEQLRTRPHRVEVVLAVDTSEGCALDQQLGRPRRLPCHAGADVRAAERGGSLTSASSSSTSTASGSSSSATCAPSSRRCARSRSRDRRVRVARDQARRCVLGPPPLRHARAARPQAIAVAGGR